MKLLYKHTIIIILLALMAFLPKWAVGQVWAYNVGASELHFRNAGSGNQFTSNYPDNYVSVFSSLGTFSKVGTGTGYAEVLN